MSPDIAPPKPRVRAQELGFFAVVVAVPLVFSPFTTVPFVDIKVLTLVAGVLAITLSRPTVDRTIACAAALWIAVVALATVLGLDPWWSLMGAEGRGVGLIAFGASAVLLCAATGVDADLRSRLPNWLFWTGVVVAVVAVLGRFIDIGAKDIWSLGGYGSTIGHRVFMGGFVAAAIIAATSLRLALSTWLGLVALGSGLAVSAARGAWVGAAIGLAVVLWRTRRWRLVLGVLVPVGIALVGWTLIDRATAGSAKDIEFSAAPRFFQLEEGSAQERAAGFLVNARSWAGDPVFGTGPATAWYGFLRNVSEDEYPRSGRGFADTHNLVLESGTTTGTVGALTFLALGVCVLLRALRAPKESAWALGAAVSLVVVLSLQPFDLVLTPLLFLSAGLATAGESAPGRRTSLHRWVAVPVAIAVALAGARFVAASLDRYGGKYASEPALRWALRFEPRRLFTTLKLADYLAFEHRSGDPEAAPEVRQLIRRAVDQHPWHPQARTNGANIALAIDDSQEARRLISEHLEIFPNDPEGLAGAAVLELRNDEPAAAKALARRALLLDPDNQQAKATLKAAQHH